MPIKMPTPRPSLAAEAPANIQDLLRTLLREQAMENPLQFSPSGKRRTEKRGDADKSYQDGQEKRVPIAGQETVDLFCTAKYRLRMDMIVLGKHIRGISTREGAELFKPWNNVGARTSGHALARNKLRLEIRMV